MKIIVTMAGLGSRFQKIGIQKPKHRIVANGRSLLEWSLLSLSDFFNEEFVFVMRRDIEDTDFVCSECEKLGISNFSIVIIDGTTNGQGTTVLSASKQIHPDDEVLIYNIDTFIRPFDIKKSDIEAHYDGFIPVVVREGRRWSFVRTDKYGKVVEIAEKRPISNLATVGLYYFRRWSDYTSIYERMQDAIVSEYGEMYIAPMYQCYIEEERHVGTILLEDDAVDILGTPEEIEAFDPNYLVMNR